MNCVSTTVALNNLTKQKIACQSFEDAEQAVDVAISHVDRSVNSVDSEKLQL